MLFGLLYRALVCVGIKHAEERTLILPRSVSFSRRHQRIQTMNRSVWLFLLLWSCMNNCFEDSCDQELTWKNAYSCCRSRDQTLPNVYTAYDVHHVSALATENDLASVWVSLRKQRLSAWTWIDGVEESGPPASEHNIGDCALYIPATGETKASNCDSSAVAFLCEIQDCNDCICKEYLPTCVLHNNRSYAYLCRNMTWHQARAFCAHEGWRLAVVRGAILNKSPAKTVCDKFWIGLRKKDWVTSGDVYEWEESSYTFWDKHEPLASGHCAVLTSTKSGWKLQAKSCQSKLPFICTKHEDSTTLQKHSTEKRRFVSEKGSFTTAPSGDYRRPHENLLIGGIIGGVGALILAFSGLMVCLICIKKKRRKPARTPLEEKSATQLEDAIPLIEGYNSDRKRIQQVIARNMLQRFSKINLWSWCDDHVEVPMNQLYTDLVWTQTHDLQASGDHIAEYTEMFRLDGKDGTMANVFLAGEAGTGKSTFTKKIATDWCKLIHERRDDDTGLSSEGQNTMQNLEFVILLCLRDIKKKQPLSEAMRDQLNLTEEDAIYLYQLIRRTGEKTLIIFDGYDEYRDDTSKYITDILHQNNLKYTNLLISSRHPRAFHFPAGKHPPGNEVSLLGFSAKGTNDFIGKFFKGENEGEKLKAKIHESDYLTYLSRFPAVLLLMVILWRDSKSLSDTMTGFYKDFVKYICGRYEKKYVSKVWRTKPENILREYHKSLMKIGSIAVNGMKKDKLDLSFPCEEVLNLIGTTAWKLGFFVRENIPGEQDIVTFPHKTLQEFFVAYYVVHTEKKKRKELLLIFCDSIQALKQSEMIVTFISGLGGEEIYEYMQAIISGDDKKSLEMSNLQLKYLSQNPGARPVLPPVVTLEITTLKYPVAVFINYLTSDISRLTRLVVQVSFRKVKTKHLFQIIQAACKTRKLEEVMIRNDDQRSKCMRGEVLYSGETPVGNQRRPTVRKPALKSCNIYFDDIESVFHTVSGCHYFPHLDVSRNNIGQSISYGGLSKINMLPLAASHLTTLNMSNCYLTADIIQSLIGHLPPSLTHLDVSGNKLNEYFDKYSMSSLTRCHLTTLNMSHCKLTSKEIQSLIDHLPPSLTHLDVSGNKLIEYIDKYSMSSLTSCHLATLNMSNCNLTADDIQSLIDHLPPSLTHVDVSGNNLNEYTDKYSMSSLTSCHLATLNMSNCNLTADDIHSLIDHLPPSLTHLDVSGNKLNEYIDKYSMSSLTRCHLKTLNMSNCDLSSRKIQSVIDHLPPSLTHLDVSYNTTGIFLITKINASLLATTQLTTLNMSHCTLPSTYILSVIDHLPPSLTHLDVSSNWANDDLGDIVNKADHMRSLRELDLRSNWMSVYSMNKITQELNAACPELNLHVKQQDSNDV